MATLCARIGSKPSVKICVGVVPADGVVQSPSFAGTDVTALKATVVPNEARPLEAFATYDDDVDAPPVNGTVTIWPSRATSASTLFVTTKPYESKAESLKVVVDWTGPPVVATYLTELELVAPSYQCQAASPPPTDTSQVYWKEQLAG
jgi:hypothetical protein